MDAISPKRSTERLYLDVEALRTDLHALLAVFMASQMTALRLLQENTGTVEAIDLERAEQRAVGRLLLATATSLRVLDDRTNLSQDMFISSCGTWLKVAADPATMQPLTVREACNKIIHCGEFEPERNELRSPVRHLRPYVHLRGSDQSQRNEWRSSISVYDYVRSGLLATHRYASAA